jgi:hypothetical protein
MIHFLLQQQHLLHHRLDIQVQLIHQILHYYLEVDLLEVYFQRLQLPEYNHLQLRHLNHQQLLQSLQMELVISTTSASTSRCY